MQKVKKHILVMEGYPTATGSAASYLTGWGCRVRTVENAAEGFQYVMDFRPSMAVIDVQAPDGLKLLEDIKSQDPDMPVIAMADDSAMEHIMTDLKNQAEEFIRKPVNPVELEISFQRVLNLMNLQRRFKDATENLEILSREKVAGLVEKERFVTVKQIVGKLSSFIAQIASEAQGGMRYFNEMPYFIAIHSRDCKVLAANPTYQMHLGDKINCNSWEIYSGKRATRNACPVGVTFRTGDVTTTRAVVRYLSGAKVPVIVHTAPIFNGDGHTELVLEVFAGTKEIERLAEEIGTTQQRYQQLFDAVPCYITVLDRRSRITAINRRFREDFGDQLGRKFHDVFIQCHPSENACPIHRTMENGKPDQAEMQLTTIAGEQYKMMAWTAPITTMAGKLIQILVIFVDITELRQLQNNLASLGLMIGTISHSLKGSLTGLDAGLYLIDTGFYRDKPGQIEEGLDVAKLMVDRIRKLVHHILYYTKERELDIEQVDVLQFANEVTAAVDTRIHGAGIKFRRRFADDMGVFEIDSGQVCAALVNILENAIEACIEESTEKTHEIGFAVRPEGDHVIFSITDNGPGMKEAEMKQIFKLFYSSKDRKGTGLGLFIARKVIQEHGGSISVESHPDEGTKFQIRLPRKTVGNPGEFR